MRAMLAHLALRIPQLRALVAERNALRDELSRLLERKGEESAGSGPARPAAEAGTLARPRLHLGCGPVRIEGWCNVDVIPGPVVDVTDDVRTLQRFQDGSADEIYACHVLEHFGHAEIVPVLRRWREVLRPGGRLRVSVPDLDTIVRLYVEHWNHFQTDGNAPWIGLIYGGQLDRFDFHRTGFNFCWMRHLLLEAGFRSAERYPLEPHFIPGVRDGSLAREPFGVPLSLNVVAQR